MELDGNTFFFYNKAYPHAKLAQWGTVGRRQIGTYEGGFDSDQLWIIEKSPVDPNYYYIKNAKHEGHRLVKWGPGNIAAGVYNGKYFEDQLWRFQQEGDYYRIYNKKFPSARIAKWGKLNIDWGTYSGDVNFDDQLWKLVPRFSAKAREYEIWSCDNRQGSQEITKEFKTTIGVKMTKSKTLTTRVGFERSLKSSLSAGFEGITAGMESTSTFSAQIESSVSSSEEHTWSKETATKYTAPPGKKYRVLQSCVDFSSPLDLDDCCLYCSERIEESS